jgi:hypothetical protein
MYSLHLRDSISIQEKSSTGVSPTSFDEQWVQSNAGTAESTPYQPYKLKSHSRIKIINAFDPQPYTYLVIDTPPPEEGTSDTVAVPNKLWEIYHEAETLLTTGEEEHFEDGMESQFSNNLTTFIRTKGPLAVEFISDHIRKGNANLLVASETLKIFGDIKDPNTHHTRRETHENFLLEGKSAYIRDGALYGLTSMNDPHSVSALKKAIVKEPTPLLRKLIDIALSGIEENI